MHLLFFLSGTCHCYRVTSPLNSPSPFRHITTSARNDARFSFFPNFFFSNFSIYLNSTRLIIAATRWSWGRPGSTTLWHPFLRFRITASLLPAWWLAQSEPKFIATSGSTTALAPLPSRGASSNMRCPWTRRPSTSWGSSTASRPGGRGSKPSWLVPPLGLERVGFSWPDRATAAMPVVQTLRRRKTCTPRALTAVQPARATEHNPA